MVIRVIDSNPSLRHAEYRVCNLAAQAPRKQLKSDHMKGVTEIKVACADDSVFTRNTWRIGKVQLIPSVWRDH